MIPLAGYADRLSVRPGEAIAFHLSNATGKPVTGRIVRVISADANPAGPGIKTEDVPGAVFPATTVAEHPVERGSYVVVDLGERLAAIDHFAATAHIWPTRIGHGPQPIIAWLDPDKGTGVSIEIGADGHLAAVVGLGQGKTHRVTGGPAVAERVWQSIHCDYMAGSTSLRLNVETFGATATDTTIDLPLPAPIARATGTKLCIGASPSATYNGKIEAPALTSLQANGTRLDFKWDFAQDVASSRIVDTGPHACHGVLINQPTRAVTGKSWTGQEMCFRHARSQYAAIHFHDDDIDDCRWPVALSWQVPETLKSGCYAVLLEAGDAKENIPFFVPPRRGKTADLAVLVSTYTYTVYGNHARPEWQLDEKWRQAWIDQAKAWGGYPHNPGQHPEYGLSTYNFHTDGSGIAHASWRRPMLNVRVGYITYPYPDIRASGLRHYPADMHLITWLEREGIAYDILTDEELNSAEGPSILGRYRCVVTGSHPEYHTPAMLDALEGYRDTGGRLMYMGGNGFYWKIALNPERGGAVEIRRAEGGIRAWAAEVGEYYNQFDGEYGGLWRRNGRPPQKLVGVGFTAQGNFVGSHYRIKPNARASRAGWIFEGVDGETFGGTGLSGHGAAGFELDRAEKRLGTPGHAIVLAASEGHKPDAPWVLVPEEQLTHIVTWAGQPAATLIRADLTYFETPNGGAVFSTGSITYCGSLLSDAATSRITGNVLRRFLDPAPLALPQA